MKAHSIYRAPVCILPAHEPRRLPIGTCVYQRGIVDLVMKARGADSESAALREGEAEFALVDADLIILFCYRFGDAITWSAAALTWGRERPKRGEDAFEKRALLHAALIGADGKTVRAQRNTTLSLDFSRVLRAMRGTRPRAAFEIAAGRRALAEFHSCLETRAFLLAHAITRCLGSW